MITVGLNLLTVALEVGADYLANYPPLLSLVQDSLCHNLLSVSQFTRRNKSQISHVLFCLQMFNSNRLHLFSAALRVAFLIFESLRTHLKYQFEVRTEFSKSNLCFNDFISVFYHTSHGINHIRSNETHLRT